jgi:inhibitor of KinA sporulation pathway (predicted exonuclease)/endonuclease/exonuclease/phosphatase family metal-dependent hydrolase
MKTRYVRPVINPALTDYCIALTKITQAQVDAAATIEAVIGEHQRWLERETAGARGDEILFVTDGDADLGQFLKLEARNKNVSVAPWYGRWCNIKVEFEKVYKRRTMLTLTRMLEAANVPQQGQLHSGFDDSVNVGCLLEHLWQKGRRVFTAFTESQYLKKTQQNAKAVVRDKEGGGGGAAGGGGEGGKGVGGGAGGLKFGSLNILDHNAFIKWTDDYGLGADADAVKASREWRFDNMVQTMRDIDCDVWGVQEVDLRAPELANRLGYTLYSHACNEPANKRNNNGVCILLRPQLMGRVVGQPLRRDNRYAPVAGVTLKLGAEAGSSATITLLTTHLKMNYPNVSVGLTELGAAIGELGVDVNSTVVMGDLNVDTPEAQQDLMDRGRLSPFLASFSVGLEATPLLPDNLLIGCNVPRFAVGVCAYVPTLLLHAKGSPFKEEFNRSIMRHQAAVSDHFPILFKIEAAFRAPPPSASAITAPATTQPLTGIGATIVSSSSGGFEIISMSATGSARRHLQVGDRIMSIGSVATSGMTVAEVKALIVGPAGSSISMVSSYDTRVACSHFPATNTPPSFSHLSPCTF